MLRILFFDALIALCCGYALVRGGSPERITGGALLVAYVATLASYSGLATRFYHVETAIFVIDTILLLVLVAVAFLADRGWPLLLAGLQLDTVGAHLFKLFHADMIRVAYALMIAVWSYPMILALAVGTLRHQQRLKSHGCDLDWTLRAKNETDPLPPR